MTDLNANLFFKAKLELTAQEPGRDLLWFLICQIRDWMVQKWRQKGEAIPADNRSWSAWKLGGQINSEHQQVTLLSLYHKEENGAQNWACRIIESMPAEPGFAPREWTTELGYQQPENGTAAVSLILCYRDRPGFFGLCAEPPAASVPNLVRRLLTAPDVTCHLGSYPLRMTALPVRPEEMVGFLALVTDAEREIPVVYVSPHRDNLESETCSLLLDPETLARILGPNALVYYGETLEVSHAMTAAFPDGLGCYSGGVRIYAPHPASELPEDRYRHRFLTASYITEHGAEQVTEILRRALAQDVHFYETMFRYENCSRMRQKALAQYRLSHWKEQQETAMLEAADSKEKYLESQLEEIENERFSWELDKEQLENEISRLKSENFNLNQSADYLRDEANRSGERQKALDAVRSCDTYPETQEDIVNWFLRVFPDRLAFTKRGLASLKECRTNSETLWSALYQMCTTLYDLYEKEDCPDVPGTFKRLSTFELARGEGTMTRKNNKLMTQYVDDYCGRKIDIETHLKSGSKENDPRFFRIYFCYDTDTAKLVVGSCGAHLDNYSTQKQH